MHRIFPILAAVILTSCGSAGVVQVSPGNYMVSKTSAGGAFANMAKMKVELIQQANAFAAQQGGVAVQTGMEESRPPVGFPSCTYTFAVVAPSKLERMSERAERDWESLSPAQRVAVQQSNMDRNTFAQQSAANRNAYNSRSAVMAMPQQVNHDVNLSGNVHHSVDVNGTVYLKPRN